MTAGLKLVIFDVDGTLVDSQAAIVGAMTLTFDEQGIALPDRAQILSIVGLSLDEAMRELVPEQPQSTRDALVAGYKAAFQANRRQLGAGSAPLYPGALDILHRLHAIPEVLLGIATGKSRRGLDAMLEAHDLTHIFVTQQVADFHPSKPHPSMIETAMSDVGVATADTVMIGDTRFDMDMARAAGVRGIGVDWGYHPAHQLDADHMLTQFGDLLPLLTDIWSLPQ